MRSMLKTISLLSLTALAAAGCAGTHYYFHPNADLGIIKTTAVLPFENLTSDQAVGEKVQRLFLLELLSLGAFDVIEPGLVYKTLKDERMESVQSLTPADIKKLGAALKAQAFFIGTVVDFTDDRVGTAHVPNVTIQLRLVEADTGTTIWSSNATRSGASLSVRLFGVGGESPIEAAQVLVRKQLKTLVR